MRLFQTVGHPLLRSCWILGGCLILQSCIQEIIWPSESRVQIYNHSMSAIKDLSIESLGKGVEEVVLVPEVVPPQSRCRVYEHDLSGNFNLILRRAVDCPEKECFSEVQFPNIILDGGSIILKYKDTASGPILVQD